MIQKIEQHYPSCCHFCQPDCAYGGCGGSLMVSVFGQLCCFLYFFILWWLLLWHKQPYAVLHRMRDLTKHAFNVDGRNGRKAALLLVGKSCSTIVCSVSFYILSLGLC